jgi:GTPase
MAPPLRDYLAATGVGLPPSPPLTTPEALPRCGRMQRPRAIAFPRAHATSLTPRALSLSRRPRSKPARKRRDSRQRRAAAAAIAAAARDSPEAETVALGASPPRFPPEIERGCVEYKLRLAPANARRFQQLLSQLKWRLHEGRGSCLYMLGVLDDGTARGLPPGQLAASLAELRALALPLGCEARVVRTDAGEKPGTAFMRVAVAPARRAEPPPVRVALAGASGAGKSTLMAALLHARLDDGGGGARACVAAHPHELLSGRTSAIRHRRLVYGAAAQPLETLPGCSSQAPDAGAAAWLCELPAPPAFARTGLFGLACAAPHVALLCVAPCGAGEPPLPAAAVQHLAAAMARGVPTAVVLSKADLGAAESTAPLAALLDLAATAGASAAVALLPDCVVRSPPSGSALDILAAGPDAAEAAAAALLLRAPRGCTAVGESLLPMLFPALRVSCVTGEGLPALHALLAALAAAGAPTAAVDDMAASQPFVFHVEEVLVVAASPGTGGSVAAGACSSGACARGDALWLGPVGRRGAFAAVRAASIHAAGMEVTALSAGVAATLALREQANEGSDSDEDSDVFAEAAIEAVGFEDLLREAAPSAPPAPGSLLARAIAQRKGLVLLPRSPGAPPPRAVWAFDAVLAPLEQRRAGGGGAALRSALAALRLAPDAPAALHCSVHCGSVRQEARLVALAPAAPELAAERRVAGLRVRAAAAAALLAGSALPDGPPPALIGRFAFAHRPQWLAPGAPLLVADPTGALVASGLVLPSDDAIGDAS